MIFPYSGQTFRTIRLSTLVGLALFGGTVVCAASPMLTRDEASARVLANGFRFVVKAERATTPPNPVAWAAATQVWDVWAVRDGIAYRVTVDGSTGDLVKVAPAVEDD